MTIDGLWLDVRYALRSLGRNRGFALVAILTIGLGIGATAAVFSLINAVLLRPLPYERPEQLVQLWETNPERVRQRSLAYSDFPVSAHNFDDYRAQNSVFSGIAYALGDVNDDGAMNLSGDRAERIPVWSVSGNLFTVLGLQPMLGRSFLPAEDRYGGDRVVIISYELWRRRFGGDPEILGRSIPLDRQPYTVVGILPPRFQVPPLYVRGEVVYREAQAYLPLWYDAYRLRRGARQFRTIARLRPDISAERAQVELAAIARNLEQAYPDQNAGWQVVVAPLRSVLARDFGRPLLVLMGAVGFVLLMACINIANLLLARGTSRGTEIAIRAAIGGSRQRLLRQLLTESLVLAVFGGVGGFLMANSITTILIALIPDNVPRATEAAPDGGVLLFTTLITISTGVASGLLPASKLSKIDLHDMLKGTSRGATAHRGRRIFSLLTASQVALAVVLLVGAGLLMKTFLRFMREDPGYRADNVLLTRIHLGHPRWNEEVRRSFGSNTQKIAFFQDVLRRVESVPGVESATLVDEAPLSGRYGSYPLLVNGGTDTIQTDGRFIGPNYFRTLGIRFVEGRDTPDWGGKPQRVVINRRLAEHLWPGGGATGKVIESPWWGPMTISGVVDDTRDNDLRAEGRFGDQRLGFQVYMPGPMFSMDLIVRTGRHPTTMVDLIRKQVLAADPSQPIGDVSTLEQRLSRSVAQPRFYALLMTFFGSAALALALIGLYGVVAHAVGQRTREIGIRMALGAEHSQVVGMVLRQAIVPVILGVLVGLAGALALTRVLASLLHGTSPTDPATLVGVPLFLAAGALLASYIPARRAARIEPTVALRSE